MHFALDVMGHGNYPVAFLLPLEISILGAGERRSVGRKKPWRKGRGSATANGKRPGATDMCNGRSRGRMSGKDGHRES